MADLVPSLARSPWALRGLGLVAAVAVRPPALPTSVDPTLVDSSTQKTVPLWCELNKDHFGKDASFDGGSDCKDFPVNTSPTAPLYDGCHFVITPDNTAYNVDDWQIVFRDQNGAGAVHNYRIQVSGSTVMATPASAIRFGQAYRQIQVITPTSAHYRLITAGDSALINSTGKPYSKTVYAHSADPTAVDTLGSTGNFNTSSTCTAKPITLFPHAGCVYPDDGSLLTGQATSGTIKGTLTCNGVAETGETVRFTNGQDIVSNPKTTIRGRAHQRCLPEGGLPRDRELPRLVQARRCSFSSSTGHPAQERTEFPSPARDGQSTSRRRRRSGLPPVSGQALPDFLLRGQYAPPVPKNTRKDLLGQAGAQVLHQLQAAPVQVKPLLEALGHLAGQGHLKLWAGDPKAQRVLDGFSLAGRVPLSTQAYRGAFVSHALGTKLDSYLTERVERRTSCSGPRRDVTLTVTLDTDAPSTPLPPYVTVGDIPRRPGIPVGDNRIALTVLATSGATLVSATVDGVPTYDAWAPQAARPAGAATLQPVTTRGHQGWRVVVGLAARTHRTLAFRLFEPAAGLVGHRDAQALARHAVTTSSTCGS